MDIPSGTLTFLFTDIEGSTGLWEKYPEEMKLALARHDEILRQAIERHNGHVFKTVGDAFCAAFVSAPDAVSAALDAQRTLGMGDLYGRPNDVIIRVRMGLHSGAAEQRDNDYFGPALNRVARLMSAGHGGQTLLSAITRELAQYNLPPGAELRDMGERSLKDLVRPEHIYQLTVPDLPADFPPLKTLEAFRTNLPVQLTSFIGREKEIGAVKSLMAEHRLTTLTGSGGTGKTRLSLQVAADLLDSFPDGVWFVEFAPLSDPALVPQTVLTTLGLREETGRSALETLSHYLQSKKVLLILDNCEHLIEAAAQLAEVLLQTCLNLHLLISSREALGIAGEKTHYLRSLSIPKTDRLPTVESASQYEAITLFVDRAKIVSSTFALTPVNVSAVGQICARLDGIPLAIELAAARIKLLKAEQIAERLDDRFRLLTGGSRTALPRHQTLRAMIDWSYGLLPEAERVLLHRLSVFAGGWTLEAAEQVCSATKDEIRSQKDEGSSKEGFLQPSDFIIHPFVLHPFDVLESLSQLVNKSLVVVDADDESTETRYRLLETVRQYAREKLSESGEGMVVRDAHLQYFLRLAERAEPEGHGAQIVEWLQLLEDELDNIHYALEWSLKRDAQVGLRLVSALAWFWNEGGYRNDADNWLKQLFRQPTAQAQTVIRARALGVQGFLDYSEPLLDESLALCRELDDKQGLATGLVYLAYFLIEKDYQRTEQLLDESLKLAQELGDKPTTAESLRLLGMVKRIMKDFEKANQYLDEALAINRSMGNLTGIANSLAELGHLALKQGKYSVARRRLDEILVGENQISSKRGTSLITTLDVMGQLAYWEGEYTQAEAYYQRGITLSKKAGITLFGPLKWMLANLGYVALRLENPVQARKFFIESQQHFKEASSILGLEANSKIGFVYVLEGLASLATLERQPKRAAQLFAFADAAREAVGDPRLVIEQTDVAHDLANIRARLDAATFAAEQAAGRAMSMDEAMAYALEATHD